MTLWSQSEAVDLCRQIEAICPPFGCHVALTGGCLYADGLRKDCDIVFYRIRQQPSINWTGLFGALKLLGVEITAGHGWCYKGHFRGKAIDIFIPEETKVTGAPPAPSGQILSHYGIQ